MTNLVDIYLVYRILRKLTTPFSEWEAFKQGVIDAQGNILKKSDDRRLNAERESFTKFDLLILKLKKLLETIPYGKSKLASYVAALWLLKEEKRLSVDNLQEEFELMVIKEKLLSEETLKEYTIIPRKDFFDEEDYDNYFKRIDSQKSKYKKVSTPISDVFDVGHSHTGVYHDYALFDKKTGKAVGLFGLDEKPIKQDVVKSGVDVVIPHLMLNKEYQSKGIGKKIYRSFLETGKFVYATKEHTREAKILWDSIAKLPDMATQTVDDYRFLGTKSSFVNLSEDAPANAVSGGGVAGLDDNPPVGKKAQKKYTTGRFANNDVFIVDNETYTKARLGKKKFVKYEKYVGNDEIGSAIREYGRKYPKKPIILQDGENGPMIFLRRGRNTFKEHLELTEEVTQSDLKKIEDYADKLFKAVGVDIEFTKHFLDRVNDERNKKDITTDELTALFRKTYYTHGKKIPKLGPDAEAVIADMASDVNMPFVLKWDKNKEELDLVAKTVMRKKNFMTSNQKLKV
jgi:hypothetical protein